MEQEKILSQFRTVQISTQKVVGQDRNMEPIYENNVIKINAHEWPLWVKNCILHGFKKASVKAVLDSDKKQINDLQLLADLQAQIDAVLKPVVAVKQSSDAEIEALKMANEALLKRLEALENKGDKNERAELIEQANQMGLEFPKNIKTEALKQLIENSK